MGASEVTAQELLSWHTFSKWDEVSQQTAISYYDRECLKDQRSEKVHKHYNLIDRVLLMKQCWINQVNQNCANSASSDTDP